MNSLKQEFVFQNIYFLHVLSLAKIVLTSNI